MIFWMKRWVVEVVTGYLGKTNPFPYEEGIFDGGADGANFTVGSNSVRNAMENHFVGKIGGLAVFDRALTEAELTEMYERSFK